jgi:hypothetical protein
LDASAESSAKGWLRRIEIGEARHFASGSLKRQGAEDAKGKEEDWIDE